MKELNQQIKTGNFSQIYLFYGPETFLIHHWQKRLTEGILDGAEATLNFETFEGKAPIQDIINAAETLPFMAERRLILCKGTGLFETGRKDDSEAMAKYIADIPPSTILVFIESGVDKRGRLFKRVKEAGFVDEAATPSEGDLAGWAGKLCASRGKTLHRAAAFHLIRNTTQNMQLLYNELEKLISYVGDAPEITIDDIDAVCTKSLDVKIFDLMKQISRGDARAACDIYAGLIGMKESPLMVLSMIARQFRFLLQCGAMAATGAQQKDIASKLSLHPFAVKEFISDSKNFKQKDMIAALEDCLETDFAIKSGHMQDVTAVELLIVKLCTPISNPLL